MSACPNDTNAVEGAHDAHAAAFHDAALESFQIDFADSLLVGPGGDAVTAFLLIVQCKVLGKDIYASVLNALDLSGSHLAGQPAVFGVVLKVSAGVRRSMNVGAGAIDAGECGAGAICGMHEVLADALAHFVQQFQIKGSCHHILRGVSHGTVAAYKALGKALRSVFIIGAGQIDGRNRLGQMEAVIDQIGHLGVRYLADQICPSRIIHCCGCKITCSQGSGNTHCRNSGDIGVVLLLHLLDDSNSAALFVGQAVCPHGFGNTQGCGGGPGAFPVVTGQIGNCLTLCTLIEIQVCIIKQVGNGVAGRRGYSIGGSIHLCQSPLCSQGSVTGAAHTGSISTLSHQDVVDSVMSITAHSEVVVTCIQNVGLGLHVIVGSQIFLIHSNGKMLCCASCDHLLIEATDLNSSLFHQIVDVILGVRRLEVDLNSMLSVNITYIFDIHIDLNGLALIFNGEVGILKFGVAQTITKGERNIIIVDIFACVALIQDIVLITGLKVAVTNIDAFGIDQIIRVTLANTGISIILCSGSVVIGCIGILVCTKVLHCRRGMVVLQESIHNTAGGVDVTDQNISDCVDAGHTHVADPQDCIDAVVVNKVQLQRIGGVKQHNDLFEGTLLLQLLQILEHLDFFLAKALVITVSHVLFQFRKTAGQVSTFTTGTGQHNKGHIAVVCPGALQSIAILFPRNFIDSILCLIAAGGIRVDALIASSSIEFPLVRIHSTLAEGCFQSRLQGNCISSRYLTGTGATIHQVKCRLGEGGDLAALRQRQGVVAVYQQGCTLTFNRFT